MNVHSFYREHNLRLHEIPRGVKCPVAKDWPNTKKRADDVDPLLDGERINKYGWIMDECHVVIDIDVHAESANGFEALEKLESEIGFKLSEVCGAVVDTPSGGRHYYFKKPADVTFGKVFRDRYPGIDFINGKGKQVIAANSCHDAHPGTYQMSGSGQLVDIPEALINHLCDLSESRKTKQTFTPLFSSNPDRSGDEFNKSIKGVETVISVMQGMGYVFRRKADYWEFDRPGKTTDSKCSGHLGKLSKQGNYQLTSFSLSDPNFTSGESVSIFHAYASLLCNGDHTKAADELYRKGFAEQTNLHPGIDISKVLGDEIDDYEGIDDEEFCLSCIPGKGLLKDVFDFYVEACYRRSNVMGLAVALSLCQTIFGRRVRSQTNLRTNDYNLIIAPTGSGKEACETVITELLSRADASGSMLLPPDIQSGNGLMHAIFHQPCGIWVCDEFGKILQSILDKKGNQHTKNIGNHLLRLYGKSGGIYGGAAHSDGVRNKVVQPHLVLLGLSTASTVFSSVSADQVSDGLIGRIAFFTVQDRLDKKETMGIAEPSEGLIKSIRSWIDFRPGAGNLTDLHPDPVIVRMSDEAWVRWKEHDRAIDARMREESESRAAVWARVAARTMKLALVHRCARVEEVVSLVNFDYVQIEKVDIEWAVKVSNWLGRNACSLVKENTIDTELIKAKTILSEAIKHGRVNRGSLLAANRSLTSGAFDAAAKSLGLIKTKDKLGRRGRPPEYYEWKQTEAAG